LASDGISIAIRTAMIATTTSNSINVNAYFVLRIISVTLVCDPTNIDGKPQETPWVCDWRMARISGQ